MDVTVFGATRRSWVGMAGGDVEAKSAPPWAEARSTGLCRAAAGRLAALAAALLGLASAARAEPELVRAFAFGARVLDCATYNEPATKYTMVYQGTPTQLQYDAGRGWGYEVVAPGDTTRGGYGIFGPFDDSANPRNVFPDTCPEEIYDSFIGAKNFTTPCSAGEAPPCLPLEGIVFRVDVPNGLYRFVAAVGSADNTHTHRVVAEDGGEGPPASLGSRHVVLVHNYDQGSPSRPGVFARVGFDGRIPPPAAVNGFANMDSSGLETAGDPDSPTLEVTQGYIRLHQLKGSTTAPAGDPNGADMVILEVWKVQDTFYAIEEGSTWRFLQGLAEASSPDTAAWRQLGFNDSSWLTGAAPIGYNDPGIVTDLSLLTPPMRNNYTSVFLRQTFDLTSPGAVSQLTARVDYDDGFLIWINGTEVLRINMAGAPGTAVAYNALAASQHDSGLPEDYSLPDPSGYLVAGTNTVAVQVFNNSLTSSDLKFELSLFDPIAPDLKPPSVSVLVPAAGTTVRQLSQVQVTFSEAVTGVNASDLRIEGSPASSVSGEAAGPYTFSFSQPAAGPVDVAWATSHGITDLASPPNPFGGGGWTYTLDPNAPLGNVVINEILAVNGTGITDEDGDESDWIELRNVGTASVNLSGWSLTDDPESPSLWVFPSVTLQAGAYLVVFASAKDRKPTSGNLHTNFELSNAGEYLGLFNAESPRGMVSQIAPRFPRQRVDVSYGLDGTGTLAYLEPPTPRSANGTAVTYDGFALEPQCSPGRGFFDAPVLVTLHTGTPGAGIRYTLNGSEPTETTGTLYTAPVQVAPGGGKGVVNLRAVAYKDGLFPSEVTTHSYVFVDSVLAQTSTPTGFPSTWNGQPADYQVDPDVVNDPAHETLVRNGLTAIPTLSIATHVDNLFSASTGIYANPSQEGPTWERPASAELIYPDGREGFQVNCGIRTQGGTSVQGWKSLKVSLRLLFKADYGVARLRFPLFPDSRVKEFDTVVLDAHLNQTWTHPAVDQQTRADYCRELLVSDLQNATGGYAPHDFFAHVYLDGLYWGVYDVHERADNAFASDYLGGDKSEYDVLKHEAGNVIEGTNASWFTMLTAVGKDMTSNTNYIGVWNHLDVPNFIDYMLVNYFVGNDDWDHHNWYATYRRAADGRWRIHSWDAEHVLKSTTINRLTVDNAQKPTAIFTDLRANPEFRLLVADRAHRLFFNGGPMYVDPANTAWDPDHPERNVPASMYARRLEEVDGYVTRRETGDPDLGSPVACESARWGDARRATPYTRNAEWLTEVTWLMNQYFPVRAGIVLGHLRAASLYPTVGAPIFSQHGGRIDPGFSLAMSRPAGTTGTIYYTTDGEDPRVFGSGQTYAGAKAYSAPIVLNDHAFVKARVLSGTTWSALNEAEFSLADPHGNVRFTEIMYQPSADDPTESLEFIELQNTSGTTVGLTDAYFSNGIFFAFARGTSLGPGEYLVLVSNLAAFEAAYPDVPVSGVYFGQLANGGETVTLSDATGREIASVNYDDEGPWPVGPDGFGYSLVPQDTAGDPNDPDTWRASSAVGGSPGAADPPSPAGGVVVSEVLADAELPLEGAIELVNLSASARNIGGWYLSDTRESASSLLKYRIPDGTLVPAGGYAVLYEYQFGSGFTLQPAGGKVFLASADGQGNLTGHIVEAEYGPEETGVSFGRVATTVGVDFTALSERSFGVDSPATVGQFRTGTGADNAEPRFGPTVINEIMYHPQAGAEEFIELFNPTGAPLPLFDSTAGRGWRISGIRNMLDTDSFEFAAGDSIPAGGFLLVVGIDPAVFRTLHSVPSAVPIAGPFGGGIDNAGERLRLFRPGPASGSEVPFILVDQVRYADASPWPESPDGGGPSLERIFADSYGNDPANWAASTRLGGTPGAANTASTPGENRPPGALFTASPSSGKAPLNVLFDASQSYDLDGSIVSYAWNFGDGGTASGRIVAHTYQSPGKYTANLTVTDDDGATDGFALSVSVSADTGGGQVPGDANQDGSLDISDPLRILFHLFGGLTNLPCGSDIQAGGNKALLNVNGDASVNLTDAIYILSYLFQSGPAPRLGARCVPIVGCPDVCTY